MQNQHALILLAVFSSVLVLTPAIALAQTFSSSQATDLIWVRTFGFERSWLSNPNELMTGAIIPSFAIFAIFLGMMRVIRISQGMGNVEYLIAIAVMLAALFTGGVGWISGLLAGVGAYSVILFVAMFIVGGSLYAYGYMKAKKVSAKNIHDTYTKSYDDIEKEIDGIDSRVAEITKDLGTEKNERKKKAMRKEQADLLMNKRRLRDEQREVTREYHDYAET